MKVSTKKTQSEALALKLNISPQDAKKLVDSFYEVLADQLQTLPVGHSLLLKNYCKLQRIQKSARPGNTGFQSGKLKRITIAPRSVIIATMSQNFKASLKEVNNA